MKNLLKSLFCLGLLIFTISAAAPSFIADITLSWNPNPAQEFVTRYLVYQAKLPSTNFVPVVTATGTNVAKVRVTSVGTYQFRVTAINGVGESGQSATVQVPDIMPTIPTNVSVISVTVTNQ